MFDPFQAITRAVTVVLLLALITASPAVAQIVDEVTARPLAGQMCPQGAYVIGFDSAGNIVCSQVCGNSRLDAGEACDDGNTLGGDGCSAACQPETDEATAAPAAVVAAPVASQAAPAAAPGHPAASEATPAAVAAAPAGAAVVTTMPAPAPQLAITDVDPSSVVYGTRETTITITGTGFNPGTVVLFDGATHRPSVNSAGTEMEVTFSTRGLAIGRYPIKVSNGPDAVVKWQKPLVVY